MRGQGNSTGLSNLMSTVELKDLLHIINYIKRDTIANKDRIALTGSSQGGILALMAACSSANIRCIVTDLASPEFASSWLENGCIKISLLWSLSLDSSHIRYNSNVKKFREWILSGKKEKWNSLLVNLPKGRDFADKLSDIDCPVLSSNAWQDKYFNADAMLRAGESIHQPFRLYFGPVEGHGSDTTSDENLYHSESIEKWLEHWLYDIPDSYGDTSKYIFASSVEPVNYHHWSYVRDSSLVFPPEDVRDMRLFFHTGNMLSSELQEEEDTASFLNDVMDRSLTMEEAVYSQFTGEEFNKKFERDYIYFETKPLISDITLIGTPKINLFYSSDAKVCQYNFQLWEVTPDGGMNFVTRINFTDRHCYPRTKLERWISGEASSHIFKKGNKIRVYVTNLDTGPYDSFLGTNPFVLPVLKRARNIIYMGGSQNTYLEMPIR
jgi:predicted acyl esterase